MSDMIDKITALRAKTTERGATEDEALAALAAADRLMSKHNISENDLRAADFKKDMRTGEFTQKQKQVHPSQKYCAVTIAAFCGIECWTSPIARNKKNLRLFGMNDDVEMAEFLMELVHGSMDRGWKEFLSNNAKREGVSRHTEYWSFMIGFAERVNQKIDKLIEARKPQVTGTGTDLISLKMAVVGEGMKAMLPDVRLQKSRSRGHRADNAAYGAGSVAGNNVNLSRPIRKQEGRKMIS